MFYFILFSWSIVDLQCCVNFCCTAKWFSYTYIHIHIYIHIFHILFHYVLSQDIEHSSLCYTVGPCCLSSGVCFYFSWHVISALFDWEVTFIHSLNKSLELQLCFCKLGSGDRKEWHDLFWRNLQSRVRDGPLSGRKKIFIYSSRFFSLVQELNWHETD